VRLVGYLKRKLLKYFTMNKFCTEVGKSVHYLPPLSHLLRLFKTEGSGSGKRSTKRGLRSSGMWQHVTGWLVPDVSGHGASLIFKNQMPEEDFFIRHSILQNLAANTSRNVGH